MLERSIIKLGIVFGIFSIITLFEKPSVKIWFPLYVINCLVNYIFDKVLVETKQVKYPIRLLPKIFKINVVYDYLVCPYLSIWYCQSTYHSKLSGIVGKLMLFATPQAIYEIILEKKTNSLEFTGNWRWLYSFFLVFVVKVISRGVLELFKLKTTKKDQPVKKSG
ncbi:CBO0543 family protein [Halalkalibacter kiskunsagensis]|uniref:CBO0543 family protein n=1 Tax=Halalkalibacter kiskunsagensis TaxID=1548599 RepID=A0ABV6KC40_9BACI